MILIPVFSISNGTRSSMMCHLNSGTWQRGLEKDAGLGSRNRGAYVATSGGKLFGNQVWESSLDLAESVHGHIEINMWLYGATQRPTWGRVVSRLHSNHREYADLTSEVIQAIHSYKGEQDELDATSGRWGLEARTVSMGMCDKYSIYPPQSKFGEPLYGGCLEALADIDDYRSVRACRWCEYPTLISVACAYRFSPSLPRTRRTAEVFRCEARQAG